MSGGTVTRKGGFGYYNIGGRLFYFQRKPTRRMIQQAMEKAEAEKEATYSAYLDCGGACCANESRVLH